MRERRPALSKKSKYHWTREENLSNQMSLSSLIFHNFNWLSVWISFASVHLASHPASESDVFTPRQLSMTCLGKAWAEARLMHQIYHWCVSIDRENKGKDCIYLADGTYYSALLRSAMSVCSHLPPPSQLFPASAIVKASRCHRFNNICSIPHQLAFCMYT